MRSIILGILATLVVGVCSPSSSGKTLTIVAVDLPGTGAKNGATVTINQAIGKNNKAVRNDSITVSPSSSSSNVVTITAPDSVGAISILVVAAGTETATLVNVSVANDQTVTVALPDAPEICCPIQNVQYRCQIRQHSLLKLFGKHR